MYLAIDISSTNVVLIMCFISIMLGWKWWLGK